MSMGTKSLKILDILPRWLLVILAMMGVYLLHQKLETVERAIATHEKELMELRIISAKMTAVMEDRSRMR